MKKIIIFIFLLFTVNVSVNADIISKIKLAYDLATLDDPAYMAMMDYLERFCNNNECESFRLPDVSMAPTLVKNDVVLVNKTAYFKRKPQRGDVVAFKHPSEPTATYIFRVAGLPGEHIAYQKKILYINEKSGEKIFQTKYILEE
ncbi:Signal peptidase I, partial [hydrothermal vent metagenome]